MDWQTIHFVLVICQKIVSVLGMIIILTGVVLAATRYFYYLFTKQILDHTNKINQIRMNLGRSLILGLEFIVAADLIGTTTTPDYYAVGLLAIIVMIRTLLTFSINLELLRISKEKN